MAGRDKSGTPVSLRSIGIASLFLGTALTSLLPILLNVRRLEYTAAIFLAPGGIVISLIAPAELVPSPLFLLAANSIFYAMCWFALGLALRRCLKAAPVQLGVRIVGLVAVALFAIACVPRFDPLWPHGMAQLLAREAEVNKLIGPDMSIDQVRVALERESIPVNEETEDSSREVLRRRNTTILADAGDRVLFSRLRTDAVQYPCGYDLEIVVLFGSDGKMKNRYVAPLPICP